MSKDMTEALRALMESTQDYSTPNPMKPRGNSAPAKSAAAMGGGGKGGGVASPLIEANFAARQYHTKFYKTSDGLFTMPAIKKVFLTDANSEPVEIQYASPP